MRSTSPVIVNPTLPCVSALPRYGTPNEKTESQLLQVRLHHTMQSYSLIYITETSDNTVKFARRYYTDLYAFCATCHDGHAPRALGFSEPPGSWSAVAMDYIVHFSPLGTPSSPRESGNMIYGTSCESSTRITWFMTTSVDPNSFAMEKR